MNKQPNIIYINFDDLGYGDLACYGSSVNDTPMIDTMCQEGLKFTNFYACSPVCSPSRGGMFTGCYPKRIGFEDFDGERVLKPGQRVGLHQDERTFANELKDVGYKTMLCGKWHCGDQEAFSPMCHGFDEWYGLPYSNDMGRQKRTWSTLEELDKKYPPLPLMENGKVIQEQPEQESLIERYVEVSRRFIRKSYKTPFLLYFAPIQVHLPLYAPKVFQKQSRNGDFGACVACVDWAIAALKEEIKKLDLEDSTVFIITSDNGSRGDHGASNAPLRGHKMQTYEGGMRVPCVVYWKDTIKPHVTNQIASNIDFYETFKTLAGNMQMSKFKNDSYDLTPLFYGNEKDYQRDTMLYYYEGSLEAIRQGKYKLFIKRNQKQIIELFDLDCDVAEQHNIASVYPDIVEELQSLANQWMHELGDSQNQLIGEHSREIGRVVNAKMLTEYNSSHPYIVALYDNEDDG